MVSLSHLAAAFLLTAGIGRPCTVRDRPSTVSRYTQSWSSVNRVYDSKARRYAEDNSTERTGKSEAEVNNNFKKNCARGIVLLKLTILTDTKHRAASLRQQSYSFHGEFAPRFVFYRRP